ncbi:MAG TPA: SpoIID/LytB domain-containing protein [Planctomycetota bacterium]|nr:SpoIID/LytB domain-containing protein [Planctomycetota bacterium]HRR80622.1 SpoIID/LytB domain-containing protein [Planctomycetota bacterium]HRT96080.1 SpoIID/LytB domain-containing protein [Planctomycetota bacterium]
MATAAAACGMVALCLAPSCTRRPGPVHVPSEVIASTGVARPARVLLAEGIESAAVSIASPYTVEPWGERRRGTPPVLATCPPLANGSVRITASAIIAGDRHFPDDAVLLRVQSRAALTLNGRRYRGDLAVLRTGPAQFDLLNVLPVEDYLYGVLAGETFPAWPAATLEAQAIIARSYALWRMAERREGRFDLYATVMDQNYLGMEKEDPRLVAAVDRTAGLALLYQMRLFRCYYHSTCGGHTSAVQDVFPEPPLLPLSAVPCQYCKDSKHFAWKRTFTKAEIASALAEKGYSVPRLASLAVASRTPSGRAKELSLGLPGDRRVTMLASDFRLAVGPGKLPSVWFEVRDLGASLEFTGHGFGHGVGLCQWGAKGMADAGFGAAEILRHYYPGAQLQRLYEPRGSI